MLSFSFLFRGFCHKIKLTSGSSLRNRAVFRLINSLCRSRTLSLEDLRGKPQIELRRISISYPLEAAFFLPLLKLSNFRVFM